MEQLTLSIQKTPRNPAHALITERQQHVLDYIKRYMEESGGIAPSQTDVAKALGCSQNTVRSHMQALVRKKALIKMPGVARGIALPKESTVKVTE